MVQRPIFMGYGVVSTSACEYRRPGHNADHTTDRFLLLREAAFELNIGRTVAEPGWRC